MNAFELIQSVAAVATAIGVGVAAWQLRITKQQAQSEFEGSLVAQYREISRRLPLDALLGRAPSGEFTGDELRAFYDYFDLSNQQCYLRNSGRLREATWLEWREGILQHLARPAFRQAWAQLEGDLDGSFGELRLLIARERGARLPAPGSK